jgi:hypothetical protein
MSDAERQYAVRYYDARRPGLHTQRVEAASAEQAAFEFGRMWQEGIAYDLTLVDVVELQPAEPTVGRGRTMAQVDDLRAHGGEVILAPPGQPDPEPDLGPRTINLGRELRIVDLHAQQRAAAAQAAAAAAAARNAPPRQLVQPDWRHYVSEEAHQALRRHGYPADYAPRGVTGDPGFSFRSSMRDPDGELVDVMLRNRVCQLDGIEVDGHAPSELDPGGGCMYCGADLSGED